MNKSQIKVIFLHGNGGGDINDPSGWFPYLKTELEKLGLKVISQNFPDPVEAKATVWLPFLKRELGADKDTILIGHSSGAVAAMRFAESEKILGSILVAPCYTDLDMESEAVSGYYKDPWNWEKIKQNQSWIVQFSSKDDPVIPIEEARYVHQMLETEYYELADQEHFGYPNPKTEFPEIVQIIKKKLDC